MEETTEVAITLKGPEIKPKAGKKARQLVILLHGLGADGNDLIGLAPEFAEILPEAHFISPNAPFPCDMSPFGHQWFSLREWSNESMLKGARIAAPVLNNFIDKSLARLDLNDSNLALIGFSQGAMMSLFVGLRRKNPCAGIICYSGSILDNLSTFREIRSKPNVCLVHGVMDPVVPYIAMDNTAKTLRSLDIPEEHHTRPLLAHGIDQEGVEIGKNFLKKIFF